MSEATGEPVFPDPSHDHLTYLTVDIDGSGTEDASGQSSESASGDRPDLLTLLRSRRASANQPDSSPNSLVHALNSLPDRTVSELEFKLADYLSEGTFSNEMSRLSPEGDIMEESVHYAVSKLFIITRHSFLLSGELFLQISSRLAA